LVGNHDWFNLECREHALESLKLLPNVTVVDQPGSFVNMPFFMVPYIHDKTVLRKILECSLPNMVLIAHLDVTGYDYGNGHVSETGIQLDELKKFRRVISGHFHKFQDTNDFFTYIGTPFSHSFGESNQRKYIGIYDATTDELTLEETPFRRHVTVEFNCDSMDEEKGHMLVDSTDPTWMKHYYRFILTGKKENIDRFPRHLYEQGGSGGKLNIKWITRPSDVDAGEVKIDDTLSNESQFFQWSKIKGLDYPTIQLGREILEAVK
jgi:DNA repair exonuclease SbcCD nuclease subunit